MSRVTGPLFKWFGSKWLSAKRLPAPTHSRIFEPFAGGAGYSLRHADKRVVLCENNPHLLELWYWLMRHANESDIREIPIDLATGVDIRTLGLTSGQALLLKNWQRTNNVGNCWTVSPWGNKPGQWTANTRARVASEVGAVKHWQIYGDGMQYLERSNGEGTWFIDPPYRFNYQYKSPPCDYEKLAGLARARAGQVIVCEAVCPKTGTVPNWLPFMSFGSRITSRRKASQHHHSSELIWHREES